MFLLNGKVIQPGSSFTDINGTQYPPQWLYQTTFLGLMVIKMS